jgi:hypothetical protein
VESACAPSVVRSTTFQPLPPHIAQSARAIQSAYVRMTCRASALVPVQTSMSCGNDDLFGIVILKPTHLIIVG